MSSFLEGFDISLEECLRAREQAHGYLNGVKARLAFEIFSSDAPNAEKKSRNSLHAAWIHLLSEAGKGVAVGLGGDGNPELNSLQGYLNHCLVDPVCWCDPATWALFYAARVASDDLQLNNCPAPSSESHLTGALIGALRRSCEHWRATISEALERREVALSLDELDLSILGGEQETGGDFALVLELSVRNQAGSLKRRAVPLIFQAKRYSRPNADISQSHPSRGLQRDLLSKNRCASAYIFYENCRSRIELPLPPLVRPVGLVGKQTRVDATIDSIDFATYLVTHLHTPGLAEEAPTAEEALRMIYSRSSPSCIAVIASDRLAFARYEAAFANLAPELVSDRDEPPLSTEE